MYNLNQESVYINGTVNEIKISKMITSQKEAQQSFYRNTNLYYEQIEKTDKDNEVNMQQVIAKQRENTQIIQQIEVQLQEMFKRSQSFEEFLEKNKVQTNSPPEQDIVLKQLKKKIQDIRMVKGKIDQN